MNLRQSRRGEDRSGSQLRAPKGAVTVSVDQAVCVGNAACVGTAPDVFVLDDNRQATVANPDGAARDVIVEAAENCPVSAITVLDAVTGETLYP